MSEPEAVVAVIRAEESDAGVLSQLIADAFLDLPPSRWLIADRAIRRRVFPDYFRIFVDAALADGIVQTTPDRSAVAIWLSSGHPAEPSPTADGHPSLPADDPTPAGGTQPTEEPDAYLARLTAITQPWVDRFLAFDTAIEDRHPHEPAHHHLAFLAVQPDRQGLGVGSALLQAHHRFLDTQNLPAYLEASHPRNRQLYLRHGYIDLGPPNYLPDGGPPMYPMWRVPAWP